MKAFVYEGEVVLGYQEGGFAAPSVDLQELHGGRPQGITAKVKGMNGIRQPKTLDEVLVESFGPVEELNNFGDESVGRLRITIERI